MASRSGRRSRAARIDPILYRISCAMINSKRRLEIFQRGISAQRGRPANLARIIMYKGDDDGGPASAAWWRLAAQNTSKY